MKKLSICIPTYNRAKYVDEAINSIVSQLTDETRPLVQIIVSDNASEDNTEEIVNKYKDSVDIVYHRNEKNMGADYNYLKAVGLADGEYALIMGSDDTLCSDAISYILGNFEKNPAEIYLSDRYECTIAMQNPTPRYFTKRPLQRRFFDFTKDEDLIEYFSYVVSLGGVFSYLTSIIFKKSCWDKTECPEKYIGSAYSHVYKLCSFIKQKQCRFYYNEKIYVNCRIGNDSFCKGKFYLRRNILDFKGYYMLAQDLFDGDVKLAFMNIMLKEHPPESICDSLIYSKKTIRDVLEFIKYSLKYDYSGKLKLFFLLYPYICFFVPFIKISRRVLRKVRFLFCIGV